MSEPERARFEFPISHSPAPVILIPSYNADEKLAALIDRLLAQTLYDIIVVNDGSTPASRPIFEALKRDRIFVLEHPKNLGKGAALKTGFVFFWNVFPDSVGLVTADGDGQHAVEDIQKVAETLRRQPVENPFLILGQRSFGQEIPLRSQFGNILTRKVLKGLVGIDLEDTQTGLRGLGRRAIAEAAGIRSNRYEFEFESLIRCFQEKFEIITVPIRTIYLDGNQTSHFNPIFDSLRIYFVFFRFFQISIVSSVADTLFFIALFHFSENVLFSTVVARVTMGYMNFKLNQAYVFRSKGKDKERIEIIRYVALAFFLMSCSYLIMEVIYRTQLMNVPVAKVIVESSFFLLSFLVQRVFVFNNEKN